MSLNRQLFSREEFVARWSRTQKLLAEANLDCLIATEPNNYIYYTGHRSIQHLNNQRPLLVLVPRTGDPVLMVYRNTLGNIAEATFIKDVRTYLDVPFPASLIIDTVKSLGLANGRIGMELGESQRLGMPYEDFETVEAGLPEAELVDASDLFSMARMVKSPAEQAKIREAGAITQRAWLKALDRVQVGMTVAQGNAVLSACMQEEGTDPWAPFFNLTKVPGKGDDYVYKSGDLFYSDFGATYDGYRADVARTAVFGQASDAILRDWEINVQMWQAAVGTIRAGALAGDVPRAANKVLAKYGKPLIQGNKRVGHGIGMDLQEPPSLALTDETVLPEGAVLTPEPNFLSGGWHYMLEEDVVVTATGHERLTTGAETLYVIK